MPKLSEVFDSKYLKADDLNGRNVTVTIQSASIEEFENKQRGSKDRKIILSFYGKDKKLVVNKTNAKTIGKLYGDDTDLWVGCAITIGPKEVEYQGEMMWAIRVSLNKPLMQKTPTQPAPAPAKNQQVTDDQLANQEDNGSDDEVPF